MYYAPSWKTTNSLEVTVKKQIKYNNVILKRMYHQESDTSYNTSD